MYTPFFGLAREPFSIAPDPRYLFMSERHREALAHLLYGVNGGGGFVLLSGEIGAGKTTVCRCFLEQIPKRCNVAYIFNPKLTATELLKSVCDEFRIPYQHEGPGAATVKDYLDPLNDFLLRTHAVGQNNLLIIDEAQNLSADVLEQLRLLTNLETSERKLLQIILIGQPELRTMLERPELEQLAQRVIARFHLDALSEAETVQYIKHRLAVAGMRKGQPFDREALRRIHKLSRGVPRRINLLADRAMLGAYALGSTRIRRDVVDKAAREVFAKAERATPQQRWRRARLAWAGTGLAAGAAIFGALALTFDGGARKPAGNGAALATAASAPRPAASTPAAPAASAPTALAAASSASSASAASSASGAAAPPLALLNASELASAFAAPIRSEREAWRELAPAWKLAVGDDDPCQAAERAQVHCFKGNGSLALIRSLGRPGILTLRDATGKPMYALLTGLDERSATLRMGDVSKIVSLAALASAWRGDFATFWRAPPGYAGNRIVDGNPGPLADWLATQLASLEGGTQPATRQISDVALKAKISAFQQAQGLDADGLAGPITFMQLNRATGVDEPRLRSSRN
jgi:general secretion pathway protein A